MPGSCAHGSTACRRRRGRRRPGGNESGSSFRRERIELDREGSPCAAATARAARSSSSVEAGKRGEPLAGEGLAEDGGVLAAAAVPSARASRAVRRRVTGASPEWRASRSDRPGGTRRRTASTARDRAASVPSRRRRAARRRPALRCGCSQLLGQAGREAAEQRVHLGGVEKRLEGAAGRRVPPAPPHRRSASWAPERQDVDGWSRAQSRRYSMKSSRPGVGRLHVLEHEHDRPHRTAMRSKNSRHAEEILLSGSAALREPEKNARVAARGTHAPPRRRERCSRDSR